MEVERTTTIACPCGREIVMHHQVVVSGGPGGATGTNGRSTDPRFGGGGGAGWRGDTDGPLSRPRESEENPAPGSWYASVEQAYQEARLLYAGYCDHTHKALGYMRSVLIAQRIDGLPSRSQTNESKKSEGLRAIIMWALGENGEFPDRPERVKGKPYPAYWWRHEMRRRLDAVDAATSRSDQK